MRRSIGTDKPALLIAALQSNPTLGDIGGNVEGSNVGALLRAREAALRLEPKLDLAVCSELALCGYQPDDLLLEDAFLDACEAGVADLQRAIDADGRASLLLGAPRRAKTSLETTSAQPSPRHKLFNSAVLLAPDTPPRWYDKHILPNYGVFDEPRYFCASETACSCLPFGGLRPGVQPGVQLGVMVCEDMWQPEVAASLARSEAALFLVLNASPYERGKALRRVGVAREHVANHGVPLLYVNQVGGQDELLFDGGSFAINPNEEAFCMPFFEEAIEIFHFHTKTADTKARLTPVGKAKTSTPAPPWEELDWQGITMGIRDYARKNDLREIVLGLSGGIDSALCAVLACEAMGAERVQALFLPSPYTSEASGEDARLLAERLGMSLKEISIEEAMRSVAHSFEAALGEDFDKAREGVVAENIQARLRALFLMAYANSKDALLLATSNKSECATGYTTLYGDMGGGYAPLKDLYKTEVYALARWCNREREIIPERILTKAPSAELRHDQRDEDALAPYEQLDALLRELIEGEKSVKGVSVDAALRRRVSGLLRRSEHKRFQSPPGPKLGARAFGRDRRYPIVNRFCAETTEQETTKRERQEKRGMIDE